jgi:hypothetical protein
MVYNPETANSIFFGIMNEIITGIKVEDTYSAKREQHTT